MKYNTKQTGDSQWQVTAGRGLVFAKVFNNKNDAVQFATLQSAAYHMKEALLLTSELNCDHDARHIGLMAMELIDVVQYKVDASSDTDASDAMGWRA